MGEAPLRVVPAGFRKTKTDAPEPALDGKNRPALAYASISVRGTLKDPMVTVARPFGDYRG